ncbi:DivIVA domain-containing protein [Micromonospora haikouensis]|uniref:DivIVA domain-containing protein n=1 Tax=Micromonospora haikouensis TaxID=686309 RepID=A0A1C4U688_9ACTN|nr:DivIVA domain-containing protein [Micromonospora haikouensis]SCE67220.1 DivIVA domain-containing protein [Micromonospora haikouensis]
MRVFLFRRGRPRRRPPVHGAAGRQPAVGRRLLPWQVRERRFRSARFGRRGLDPQEVREFLERVAVEMAAAHEALAQSRREASEVKVALCRLRSEASPARNERGRGR